MNYGLIAIYDNDSEYANCLANYFRLKGCLSSEIVVFTRENFFSDFVQEHSIDILLINQALISSLYDLTLNNNIFVLGEQRNISYEGVGHYIYKYSSAEDILRFTMASYEPSDLCPHISFIGKKNCNIVGIYSPLCRCGKTSFSLALAIQYGMRSSCLFLSMDEASTLRYLLNLNDTYKGFDDLLYYFLQSSTAFESKLVSITKQICGIDVVPPFAKPAMFSELSTADWSRFIQTLADIGKYEYIVIDFGAASPVHPLFTLCQYLYLPNIMDDSYAIDKLAIFNKHLQELNISSNTHIQNITLPYVNYHRQECEYLRELTSSEIGALAASIAKES